ncbi:Ferrochelatase protein [Cylindrospermopsis raciborskii CS-505]|nr:Ferrochelatase protein [Cylindrospermopsis raciborskii CS-505]
MPIGFATENHETLLDVHHIIHDLEKQYSGLDYVQMPCVNDHPQFLEMAAGWANTQISELMKEAGQEVNLQLSIHHHHHH